MNEKRFAGGYTYKKGARWMSELDHAVASKNILADVLGFEIVNTDLKSDHKPISTTLRIDESEYIMDQLLNKSDLFMSYEHLSKPTKQAKTRAATTDTAAFQQAMGAPSSMEIADCNVALACINEKINNCAKVCRKPQETNENNGLTRHQNR